MDLIEAVKAAGVVGAGGAGFPTHVKLAAKAECFVVNGAECEPLIETDKYLMRTFPDQIVQAVVEVASHVGAKRAVIALKKKYVKEVAALRQSIAASGAQIELFEMSSFYPAGDEQVLIQQVCGTSVPERGIPLDVGAVVDNVGTLLNIHDALQGIPVTEKYLSVVGEVERPVMRKVPLGTPLRECISSARPRLQDYIVILGGPMMGRVVTDPAEIDHLAVTKTTGNLIVLPREHYLACRAALSLHRMKVQAKSACVQCRMCTSLCPRYLIGHQIQPHLMMRNLFREDLITDKDEYQKVFGQAANCCDCGVCEMFSCPMGLSPRKVNAYLKGRLREQEIQTPRNLSPKARDGSLYGKVPTDRLVARLGLSEYYHLHAGDYCTELFPEQVWISFRQHIGKPAVPAVQVGETVHKGFLLASAAPEGLSANIHASISGIVTEINADGACIRRDREA
ncbi:4Fe-4S dicluster domain-containing protein [Faecalispora anaeroviscerum]|uniref:4Fe-4S dicluster domain-containing protein n=1 Tax=Faecalispora anaeroviscerum TaxID=2991836 RepID=UPI0024B94CA4|nr:4Fe-4S dicluster domain-containing protein [Faecalispora anaeroviscerum]